MSFTHLHLHSEYSLLDSMVRVDDLVASAIADGQPAIAVTDHGSLGGVYPLVNAVRKANKAAAERAEEKGVEAPAPLKAIVGMEAYLAIERPGRKFAATAKYDRLQYRLGAASDADSAEDAVAGSVFETARYEHITLLAMNNTGWHNLLALHNLSQARERIYSKPRIDYDLMEMYSEGLIVLTGCLAGPAAGNIARARELSALTDADRVDAARSELLARKNLLGVGARAALADCDSIEDILVEARKHLIVEGKPQSDQKRAVLFDHLAEGIPSALDADAQAAAANAAMERLIDIFGAENVYVEVMDHDHPFEGIEHILDLYDLAEAHGLELVATNDCHHTVDDKDAHDVWLAHGSKKTLAESTFRFDGSGYHLRTDEEMRSIPFKSEREVADGEEPMEDWYDDEIAMWERACDMTNVIAERIEPEVLDADTLRLPSFTPPEGYTSKEYLEHLVTEGAQRIYGAVTEEVAERLREEMDVISEMGLWDYFLISWDMISFCRREGIAIGFGRGSAAGSAVSYCLGIVGVDPLEYGLLFERFLEPGRAGMPDIDFDIEDARRQEVFDYMRAKYGDEHVAHIGAWQNFKSKQAIHSVVKTLGHPRSIGDELAKLMPMKGAVPRALSYALDESNMDGRDFRKKLEELGDTGEEILELAGHFEKVTRGQSVHPAGLIIADENLSELIPLRLDKGDTSGEKTRVSLWDMDDVDSFGLLKLDLLGLRNLSFLALAQRTIATTTGEEVDYLNLPHPDTLIDDDLATEAGERDVERVRAAYTLLGQGRTPGIFQMESSGMTDLISSVNPESLADIAAVVALYRPGPMGAGMHTLYTERKSGRQEVDYSIYVTTDEEEAVLDSVLGHTYGCLLYQEQMMTLGAEVAGFDAQWRSKMRKAVSKKLPDEMREVGQRFIAQAQEEIDLPDGRTKPAYSESFALELWKMFSHSADYIFNASHAYAYAKLAYATAYFKANWPVEYAAAVLARTPKGDKRQSLLSSLASEGVQVQRPDINTGEMVTAPKDGKVWIGFSEIKDVGSDAAEAMLEERAKNGPYESLADFLRRMTVSVSGKTRRLMNARSTTALIEAGAFDAFGPRKALARLVRAQADHIDSVPVPGDEWEAFERAERERNRLGVVLGEDPITSEHMAAVAGSFVRRSLRGERVNGRRTASRKLQPLSDALAAEDGDFLQLYGTLTAYGEKSYKHGTMATITASFGDLHVDAVMWDKELTRQKETDEGIPRVGAPVAFLSKVKVERRIVEHDDADESADEDSVAEEETRISLTVRAMEEITEAIGEDHHASCDGLAVRPSRPGETTAAAEADGEDGDEDGGEDERDEGDDASGPDGGGSDPSGDDGGPAPEGAPESVEWDIADAWGQDLRDFPAPTSRAVALDEPVGPPAPAEDAQDRPERDSEPAEAAEPTPAESVAHSADHDLTSEAADALAQVFCIKIGSAPKRSTLSLDGIALRDVIGSAGALNVQNTYPRQPVVMRGQTDSGRRVVVVSLSAEHWSACGASHAVADAALAAACWSGEREVTLGIDFEIARVDVSLLDEHLREAGLDPPPAEN